MVRRIAYSAGVLGPKLGNARAFGPVASLSGRECQATQASDTSPGTFSSSMAIFVRDGLNGRAFGPARPSSRLLRQRKLPDESVELLGGLGELLG